MVGVVEVFTVVFVVGVFEEAKCPKKKKKRLTHFKTMPQAAGKNCVYCISLRILGNYDPDEA